MVGVVPYKVVARHMLLGINSQSLCFGNHFGLRKKRKKNEEVGIEVGKKRCKRWKEFEKKRRE